MSSARSGSGDVQQRGGERRQVVGGGAIDALVPGLGAARSQNPRIGPRSSGQATGARATSAFTARPISADRGLEGGVRRFHAG